MYISLCFCLCWDITKYTNLIVTHAPIIGLEPYKWRFDWIQNKFLLFHLTMEVFQLQWSTRYIQSISLSTPIRRMGASAVRAIALNFAIPECDYPESNWGNQIFSLA